MANIPPRLSLALVPTPIEKLERLSKELNGPEIYIKRDDLTGSLLSGNKIRKLEYSLAEALAVGADVIITAGGIQSNHCRATAISCAKLGLKCHLVLRGGQNGPPDGNLLLDYLAGATFSFFPREQYSTDRPAIVENLTAKYAAENLKAYWIPVGASNAIGSWGYINAYQEIMDQHPFDYFDHIVAAVGSGGTNTGLITGKAISDKPGPQIWGVNVCDDADYFKQEIIEILNELNQRFQLDVSPKNAPIEILDGYVGDGYAIPYPEEIALIKHLAQLEGIMLDPVYTGKAMYGLVEEIRKGRFKKDERVLFLHTGGMFGLFPQKDVFGFPEQTGSGFTPVTSKR